MRKLIVIGAGDGFLEVNELIDDINEVDSRYEIIGILDDNPEKHGAEINGYEVLGSVSKALEFSDEVKFILAIGSHRNVLMRHEIIKNLNIPINRFETIVHPTVKIFRDCEIGSGCIIHFGTVIFSKSKVSDFSVISANCVLGVKNLLGKGSLLGSNITTTTGVKIGSFSFIGSSVTIGENLEVKPGAVVGLGTTLLQNVKPGLKVIGTPFKVIGKQEVSEEILNNWNKEKEENENN